MDLLHLQVSNSGNFVKQDTKEFKFVETSSKPIRYEGSLCSDVVIHISFENFKIIDSSIQCRYDQTEGGRRAEKNMKNRKQTWPFL